jgi:hypothetical protein
MEKENLHFRIGLSGTGEKLPEFKISVGGTEYVHSTLSVNHAVEYFEFDAEIIEGAHSLDIAFLNKKVQDTRLDIDGNIVEDLLLNIDSIEIDEIDIGNLKWTASVYTPLYPESYKQHVLSAGQQISNEVKNCVNLGWNGTWSLPFTSPVYIWLLENI